MLFPRSLTSEVISTTDQLASQALEWQQLWESDPRATPFQSPAWLLPWWKHLGEGQLFCVAVRDSDRLIALLPAFIFQPEGKPTRELMFLGAGTTDYLDALIVSGREQESLRAIFDAIVAHRAEWDTAVFRQLRPDSPLLGLRELSNDSFTEEPSEPCCCLRPGTANAKPKIRDNLTYYRHRAEKRGNLGVWRATKESAGALFQGLVAFHTDRWRSRGQPGVLSEPRVQRAHAESIALLDGQGMLRLFALTLNDEPIAVIYALADPASRPSRKFYCYLTGFDPAWNSLSPGTLVLGALLDQAAKENVTAVDFLRGQERYKQFWGVQILPTKALELRPEVHVQT
jgi:CelD/BcsL family acetyltransferase involved in cellulose biosynthesis